MPCTFLCVSIPGSVVHNYTYSRKATLAMPLPRTVLHSLLCTPCVIHTRSLYITQQLSQQSTMVYIRKDSMLYTAVLRKSQGIRDVELLNKYFLRQICTQDYGLCLERSSITLPLHQGESYRSYIHTL